VTDAAAPGRTATARMISTIDPEARHIHKIRVHRQDGFKARLAVGPETRHSTATRTL
jgi:hypothetical protein